MRALRQSPHPLVPVRLHARPRTLYAARSVRAPDTRPPLRLADFASPYRYRRMAGVSGACAQLPCLSMRVGQSAAAGSDSVAKPAPRRTVAMHGFLSLICRFWRAWHQNFRGLTTVGVVLLAGSLSSDWAMATAVGRTPGAFQVDARGAATYAIPINVAPGINGLRPSVALVYDSQAGDGPVGMGWNLAGFSQITPCNKTVATHGYAGGVSLSLSDRYCLDGQPRQAGCDVRAEINAQSGVDIPRYSRIPIDE